MAGRHRTDELDDGHRRRYSSRQRTSKGKVIVPLAGAVALAILLGVAAFVVVNRDRGCAKEPLTLQVVASPDIQPTITEIAGRFTGKRSAIDGRCVQVAVRGQDAAVVANALGGAGAADGEAIDLWIPDSSLWVSQLAAKGVKIGEPSRSVAQSPIVLVASRTTLGDLEKTFGAASWAGLVSAANLVNPDGIGRKVRVLALDPARNAAGLGAMLAASGVMREAGKEDQLIGALKQLSQSLARSPDALLSSLDVRSERVPIGVASEHAVWAYNTTKKPDSPVVPLYPAEGTLNLDYPAVITTKDATVRKAADAFSRELVTPTSQTLIRRAGFRTADGQAGAALLDENGFEADPPPALDQPDAAAVAAMRQSWSRLNLGTRLLALYDVSGTMAYKVPGTGTDRMRVIAQIAAEGLKLFTPDSEIGAWEFSTHLNGEGVDYIERVPVGPLTESVNGVLRRDLLLRHLSTIRARKTGDTGLNDTLAAAYERMTKEYQPDKINTILVLTDGAGNDDPDGGLSDQEILRRLRSMYDETKPVNILIIAFGPDAPRGQPTMEALARATGGEAYIAKDVLQVRQIFLESMKRRICSPNCDG